MSTPSISLHGLFSSRDTLEEAVAYATELLDTLPSEHQLTALTAYWVTVNTVLKKQLTSGLGEPLPYPDDERPSVSPATATPEQATRILRTIVPRLLAENFLLSRAEEIPPLFTREYLEGTSFFLMFAAKAMNLDVDTLQSEVRTLINQE